MEIILALQILDNDIENVNYLMISEKKQDSFLWKNAQEYPFGEDYHLRIQTDSGMRSITQISIGAGIQTKEEDIREAFLTALFEAYIRRQTDEADGFEHTHDANRNEEAWEREDYDPKLIRVDAKPFSIEYVCMLISDQKIDLSPDFQREFVWTDMTRKSRLIESIMLRIPIPMFYLSQSDDGKFQVVDGIQRLTVISQFINNKFKLKNLEYLKKLEGRWFRAEKRPSDQSIPTMYADRIEQTTLFFNIIDPSTPERVKYDIFRRINTGGKVLNAQEIRNCLSNVNTRKLLKDMTALPSFMNATRGSISRTRMADKEMAMRFAGFFLLDRGKLKYKYTGNMDEFLDHAAESLNKMNEGERDSILKAFDHAMSNAFILFGSNAFRKTAFINKALFLSWSRLLCSIKSEALNNASLMGERGQAVLQARIRTDESYQRSISTATNDVWCVEKSFETAKEILRELML